jgi:diamine N-acetyltransferase
MERRPVLREHVLPLIGLKVRPDQADLVSSNAKTLAEAAYETGSTVWGLWDQDVLVGLMAMIHPGEYPWDDYSFHQPGADRTAAYLWRLMVGAEFQGRGYGGAHVSDAPHSNLPFYERFGFRNTGVIEDGELVIVLDL